MELGNQAEGEWVVERPDKRGRNVIRERSAEKTNPVRTGFGGWLWLVVLGLMVGCVDAGLYIGAHLLPMLLDGDALLLVRANRGWAIELVYELATHLFFLVVPIVLLLRCFRRERTFVSGMIFYYIANLAINVGALGLAVLLPALQEQPSAYYKGIVQAAVICAVWIPYFRRSVRVRNTYIQMSANETQIPR